MKSPKIRIANPVPGEAHYTSKHRAEQHVAAQRARFTERGELFFFDNRRTERFRRDALRVLADHSIDTYRGGVVFWNGDGDPHGRTLPGLVRS